MTALATTASSSVLIAVLAAAVLHASWNAIAHAVRDRLVGFTLMGIVYTVGGAVIAAVAARPSAASWGFLAASAVLHVAYNLLLMRSYRLGQFGQVYPLARGTSPLLVAIAAAVFVGEPLPGVQLAGVLVISAGLASLVLTGGLPSRAGLPAITAAVATGVMIAAYTTVDGLGVRRAGTAAGYIGWLFLLQGPALLSFPWNRGDFFMVDGLACGGKLLLGVSSTWSPVSSSRRMTSSQLGQLPPAPWRWQGRRQSWHHCSPR